MGGTRYFSSGQAILSQGEHGDEMYVIREGQVRIFVGSGDKEVTLAILSPGEFFGEMALMGDYERSANAVAVGDVSVSVVDRDTFRSYISEPIVLDIMGKMADRIRSLDKDVVKSQVADMNRRAFAEGRVEQRHWFT